MFIKIDKDGNSRYIFGQENTHYYDQLKPLLPNESIFYIDKGSLTDRVQNIRPHKYEELSVENGIASTPDKTINVEIKNTSICPPLHDGKVNYPNFLDNFDMVVSVCFDWDGTPFTKANTLFSIGGLIGNGAPDSLYEFSCKSAFTTGGSTIHLKVGSTTHTMSPIVGKNHLIVLNDDSGDITYVSFNGTLATIDRSGDINQPKTKALIGIGGYHSGGYSDYDLGFGHDIYNFYVGKFKDTVWMLDGEPNEDFLDLVHAKEGYFDFDESFESEPVPNSYVGTTDEGGILLGNFEVYEII